MRLEQHAEHFGVNMQDVHSGWNQVVEAFSIESYITEFIKPDGCIKDYSGLITALTLDKESMEPYAFFTHRTKRDIVFKLLAIAESEMALDWIMPTRDDPFFVVKMDEVPYKLDILITELVKKVTDIAATIDIADWYNLYLIRMALPVD